MTGTTMRLCTVLVALLTVTAVLAPATAGAGVADPGAHAVATAPGAPPADDGGQPGPPGEPLENASKADPAIEDGLLRGLDEPGVTPDGVAARTEGGETVVQVVVEAAPGRSGDAAAAVRRAGGSVEVAVEDRVQVRVAQTALRDLARSPAVTFVRRPHRPVMDAVESHGTVTIGADEMHAEGYTGENATVAVIDTGFDLSNTEIADNVVDFNDVGDSDFTNRSGQHGTAVSELVVDAAPDVNLIAVEIHSATEFRRAINWIDSETASDAVVFSGSWFNVGPLDGTSRMDRRVNGSTDNGTLWFTSAGNYGDDQHLNLSWRNTDGDAFLEYDGSDDCLGVPQVSELEHVFVQWNDWPGSDDDYDLALYNQSGSNLIRTSTNVQNGTQAPTERIGIVPRDGHTCLRIQNFSADGTAEFDVYGPGVSFEHSTSVRSIPVPGTNRRLVSVGAMDDFDGQLQPFSSRGPTIDGRRKPDLVAPDNVTTTTLDPFFGTSAAAPYAAGVAALLVDADPTLTPAETKSTLTGTTTFDVTAGEPNNESGSGLVDAENATLSLSTTPPQSIEIGGRVENASGGAVVDASAFAFPTVGDGGVLDRTNATGNFLVSPAGSNGAYEVEVYQNNFSDSGGADSFPRDGVVDLYAIDEVAGNVSTDLGTVSLPTGHVLNVTVVNESNAAVANASVDVTHVDDGTGATAGLSGIETDPDGRIRVGDGGNATGVEVAGNVTVAVTPPEDGPFVDRRYEQSLNVTSDEELTVTLNETDGNVTITGTIERADGSPAVDDSIDVAGDGVRRRVATDADGNFSVSVPANGTYSIGYFQGNFSTEDLLTSLDDGSPDMYSIDNVDVGTSNVSLGTVSLPTGYNVTVTVRNESGVPVQDARVRLVHANPAEPGLAFGSGRHSTDAQGRFVLRNADHPGMEMANDTKVQVHPPENDTRFVDTVYEFTPTLSGPLHLNVTLEESDNVALSGRIVLANGSGAVRDRVWISGGNVSEVVFTDADGNWNHSVPPNTTYSIGYFQGDPDGEFVTGVDDDSPDVRSVRDVAVGDGPRDVGNMTLPAAHDLNVTVVDESNDPVENAQVSVGHRNTTTGTGFGGANGNTNADGLFEITPGDPGVEIRGQAEVDVNPPSGSDRFVDETVERTVNVSGDTGVTITLNETGNVSITQNRAWSTGSGPNQTKLVAIQPDANLTLDNGTTYHFAFTNEDTGQSATLAANGSTTVGPGDSLVFVVYEPDGSVRADPIFHGSSGSLDADVVNNSIPTASGLTNFSVTLLNASTGAVINGTTTEPSVVGYTGVLTQNSTTGQVRLSMPRDVLPTTANGTLQLSEDITDGSVEEFAFPMTYDAGSDEFATVVDAENFTPGDYQWEADYDWRGTSLILQVTSPSTTNENVTLESDNVTLTGTVERADGSPAVDDTVAVAGAGLGLKVGTDENGTFSVSVPPNATYSLGYYQGNFSNGTLESSPDDGWVDVRAIREVTVGTTNPSAGTMTLPAGHNLTVTVVNESGVPVENALVDVFHFNDTAGSGFGTSPTETDAQGRFRHGSPRHVGMETSGTTEVQVEPPTGSDEYVDKVYTESLTVTNDTHVEVQLNETNNVTVRGRVVRAGGAPAADDQVVVHPGSEFIEVGTNATGWFNATVPENSSFTLGYYQGNFSTGATVTSEDDGSPDLLTTRHFSVGTTDENLGDVTLPPAHNLTITVENESGVPVADARVRLRHSNPNESTDSGFGTGDQLTDARGRFVHSDADHPGMEMANDTIVEVRPPENADGFVDTTYRLEPSMDQPRHLTVTLNETENVTVTGRVVLANGSGAVRDRIIVVDDGGAGVKREVETDAGGNFSVTVPANATYVVGYHQSEGLTGPVTSLDDGSPDIFSVREVTVATNDTDLGDLPLPTAHQLNVSVVDESGDPVANASVFTVAHRNLTTGFAFGTGSEVNADGLLEFPAADHPGVEMRNRTIVEVDPPDTDRFVDKRYTRVLNLTADGSITIELEEANASIEQNHGFTTSDAVNTTKIVGIRADANLTLDNGTNYRFRLADEDAGESVTLVANGSAELGADDPLGLRVHAADGSVADTPKLLLPRQGTQLEADVVSGSIPASSGATNFTVTLLDGSGTTIDNTAVHVSVIGYTGVLAQNSTTGDVRLSLPRDVAPTGSNVTLVLSEGDLHDGSPRFEFAMTYDAGADEFATVVDASNFSAGDYSWETFVGWRGTPRILQVRSPNSANENVTLESENVTITGTLERADGSPAVDDTVDVSGDADRRVGTDANGTFSVSVPANGTYRLGYYQGNFSTNDLQTSLDDGSVDMYTIDQVDTGTTNVSLGTVSLPTGHNVTVTVRNESGVPVRDARVRLVHSNPNVSGVFYGSGRHPTDAQGRFVLRNVDHPGMEMANDTEVRVLPPENDPRFVDTVQTFTPSLDGPVHLNVTLSETDNVTLSGRVVLANGSGASVDRVILADGNVTTTVATDGGGNFNASVPANATYAVGYHQGDVPGQHVTSLDDGSPDLFSFGSVTVGGNDTDLGNLTLPDAFNVNVTVVDESGDPVEDARVHFAHQSGQNGPTFGVGGSSYTTNASGLFVVEGTTRPGVEMRNRTTFEVRPPAGSDRFEDRAYERTLNVTGKDSVTFELNETNATAPPTINVSGRVFEPGGAPADNDTIFAISRNDPDAVNELFQTDATGNFTASGINASAEYHFGYYQNFAADPASDTPFPRDGSPDLFALWSVNSTTDVDVGSTTLPPAHVVNVTVVNESNVPVENASVNLTAINDTTGARTGLLLDTRADGMIEANDDATGVELRGHVVVNVTRPENATRFVDRSYTRELNVTGPEDLVFELREKHNVTGRLLENDSTAATEDLAIANSETLDVFEVVPTGGDGNYSATLGGEDRYGFTFAQRNETSGTITERDGTVDLYTFEDRTVAGDVDLGTRTMPEGHLVNISVVSESGDPVENATVAITSKGTSDDPTRTSLNAGTNADGVVQFNENVTPGIELSGDVTLEVSRPDGDERFVDETVVRNLTVTAPDQVTVELRETNNVTGRLLRNDSSPAAEDFVVVKDESGSTFEVLFTDGGGNFSTTLNDTARYGFTAAQRNDTSKTITERDGTVDLYLFEERTVSGDVDLGTRTLPAGHLVNVSVVDESGDPVENASVAVTPNKRSTNGTAAGLVRNTTAAGVLQFNENVTPGIELAGNVTIEVDDPPTDRFDDQTLTKQLTITGPRTVEFVLQEQINITGRVFESDGDPAVDDTIFTRIRDGNGSDVHLPRTNATGAFEMGGIDAGRPYHVGYYQGNFTNTSAPSFMPNDGSPDMYAVDVVNATDDVDLGNVSLPAAHVVNVTVVNESDVPVANASVGILHNNSATGARTGLAASTGENGTLRPGNETGIELVGNVTVTVEPPENATGFENRSYERNLTVTGDRSVNVTLEEIAPFGVTTRTPTDVGGSAATLRGNLTGLGGASSADVQFKYWVEGDEANTSAWTSFVTLTEPGAVTANVTGLQSNTTYVYRVQARDSSGNWTAGSTVTFTTAAPFGVATTGTANVTDSAATLEGNLTGLGGSSSADVQFKYWVEGDEANTSAWTSFETLSSPGTVTANVTGLAANTTYVFRVQARDDDGDWTAGSDVAFTTTRPFAVETDPATDVGASAATLHGNLTGLGGASSVEVQFTYWVEGQQGSTQQWTTFETRSATGPFDANVTGLQANTTYVVRAQAKNPDGEYAAGTTRTFTTAADFGVATTGSSNVTNSSATLEGELTGLGDASSADVQFKYWEKGDEANTSAWTSFETLSSPGPFSADVTGLQPNTTYVFRAQARDDDGDWTAGTTVEVTTGG